MKLRRVLLSLFVMTTILLAISLQTFAIGFDVEKTYESVFVIHSGNSLGSGFSIGENCIITNAHVIGDVDDVVIKTYSGESYGAFVVGINVDKDIAVLGVQGVKLSYLTVADDSTVKVGDDIYAVGAPKSMEYTLTKGVVSARNREIGGNQYIQIDAAINEGNSGGPLLNDSGQVVGINTLKLSDSEGIGLSIPMNILKGYLITLGMDLNESGNVNGDVELMHPEEPTDATKEKDNIPLVENESSVLFLVVCIVAVSSLLLNIVLIVLLVYQKKKNLNLKYDPRDRTDFDIDILG